MIYPLSLIYIRSKNEFGEPIPARKNVVILAAWNEETYIESTLRSIFLSTSIDTVESVLIGDDSSTDATLQIIKSLQLEFPKIKIESFDRIGKPSIVNKLVEKYQVNTDEYNLLFIDANISLESNCLERLAQMSNFNKIGLIGSSILPKNDQINFESEYILRENKIKVEESRALNYTIGVFGACYMMKGEFFRPTPERFITDDLYHSFSIIALGKKVLYSDAAFSYEDITLNLENEFIRKRRYSAGNFQILIHFWKLILPFNTSFGFGYAYFFHKIMRWISPIVFFGFWVLSFFGLFDSNSIYILSLGIGVSLFLLINYLLHRSIESYIFKRLYYFLIMNLAIFFGCIDYLKGIKTNVWERSNRV